MCSVETGLSNDYNDKLNQGRYERIGHATACKQKLKVGGEIYWKSTVKKKRFCEVCMCR